MKKLFFLILIFNFKALADQQELSLFLPSGESNYTFDQNSQELFVHEDFGGVKHLRSLRGGEHLSLSDGRTFVYNGTISSGNNTVIVKSSNGRALRIMQNPKLENSIKFFKGFYGVYAELIKIIPAKHVVKVFRDESGLVEVIEVEELEIEETMDVYLSKSSLNQKSKKFLGLLSFIEAFQGILRLDDFWPFQVGWVENRGWVLFDWGNDVEIDRSGGFLTHLKWIDLWKSMSVKKSNIDLLKAKLKKRDVEFQPPYLCRGILW